MTHLVAIPLLATPATAFVVDDAHATAAAAWIGTHAALLDVSKGVNEMHRCGHSTVSSQTARNGMRSVAARGASEERIDSCAP
jgi:hypothetical protein